MAAQRVEGLSGRCVVRTDVNFGDFRVADCQNCSIVLLDACKAVTVDECRDCEFLLGACSGSVFIRDCENCRFATVSQQLRLRGCERVALYALSKTAPIIETSRDLKFYPFGFRISEKAFSETLAGEIARKLARATGATEIDYRENKFTEVYDFSPEPGKTHFQAFPAPTGHEEPWARPSTVDFQGPGLEASGNCEFLREDA